MRASIMYVNISHAYGEGCPREWPTTIGQYQFHDVCSMTSRRARSLGSSIALLVDRQVVPPTRTVLLYVLPPCLLLGIIYKGYIRDTDLDAYHTAKSPGRVKLAYSTCMIIYASASLPLCGPSCTISVPCASPPPAWVARAGPAAQPQLPG